MAQFATPRPARGRADGVTKIARRWRHHRPRSARRWWSTTSPTPNPKTPCDAFKDFVPIAHDADAPNVLIVGQSFPARSAKERIALL
jgi:hypothetical protein